MCARKYSRSLMTAAGLIVGGLAQAQNWRNTVVPEPSEAEANPVLRWVRNFTPAYVEYSELKQILDRAPLEILGLPEQNGVELRLPLPDGRIQRFNVWENDILGPQVKKQIPGFRVFAGQGIDDPTAILRCELGYGSFTAMIRTSEGMYFIEPMKRKQDDTYFLYSRKDSIRTPGWVCATQTPADNPIMRLGQADPIRTVTSRTTGSNLWTFDLALNSTGEYVTAVAGTGNTTTAVSKMVISVNRVDGVYRTEMSIRLNLTYTKAWPDAATDPFTNGNGGTMLSENQTNLDATPGNAAYDIGHVFSTGGGGVAGLGVVGITGQKARGVTGNTSPVGDTFDIDYVAHEMGHQFNCNHSFNGTTGSCGGGNRNGNTAWEPGSATTIMGYAGICGTENVQAHSDPYFHIGNIEEAMIVRTAARGGSSASSGNSVPVVNAGPNYTVPISTPFKLTMSASDANGDALTYNWEPGDKSGSTANGSGPTTATNTVTGRAMFRTLVPSTSPVRFFPSQSLILAGTFNNQFEFLPVAGRTLLMRAVARDNRSTGGGVNVANMTVTAAGTAAFAVSSPVTAVSWNRNSLQTVTWNVSGTNVAPFNAANVNIYLSTDGGASYFNNTATLLAGNTPNDGSQAVSLGLGTAATNNARIIVEAVNNVFFSVPAVSFSITTANTLPTIPVVSNQTINEESAWTFTVTGTDADTAQTLAYSLVSPPAGMTINSTTGQISWTPTEAQGPGTYPVTVRASDNAQPTPGTFDRTFNVTVNEVAKNVTGTVNFLSYIPSEVGQLVQVQIGPNPSGAIIASGNVNVTAGNAFTYNASVAPGVYAVYVKRDRYLRRKITNVNITSTGAVTGTYNLIPGDLDNSGEIDAIDIDLAIANFGSTLPTYDVDGSGEVDAIDIDLIIANFGQVGD